MEFRHREPAPRARPSRPAWATVPPAAVAAVEAALGPVVAAAEARGGYSAAAAWRLTLAGGRVFAKARHPGQAAAGRALVDAERRACRELPEIGRFGPAFLGTVAADGWAFHFLADAAGAPALPWSRRRARRALACLAAVNRTVPRDPPGWLAHPAQAALTAPLFAAGAGWAGLAADGRARRGLEGLLDPLWLDRVLGRLVALEARGRVVGGPCGLLHMDARSDNMLFRAGAPVLLDWSYACRGPAVLDLAFFLPALVGESGFAPAPLVAAYAAALGRPVAAGDLAAALALATGSWAQRAPLPVPPQMPQLRWIQRLQLFAGLKVLAALGAISPPPPSRPGPRRT